MGEDNPILYGWLGTMWANSRRIGDVQVSQRRSESSGNILGSLYKYHIWYHEEIKAW